MLTICAVLRTSARRPTFVRTGSPVRHAAIGREAEAVRQAYLAFPATLAVPVTAGYKMTIGYRAVRKVALLTLAPGRLHSCDEEQDRQHDSPGSGCTQGGAMMVQQRHDFRCYARRIMGEAAVTWRFRSGRRAVGVNARGSLLPRRVAELPSRRLPRRIYLISMLSKTTLNLLESHYDNQN